MADEEKTSEGVGPLSRLSTPLIVTIGVVGMVGVVLGGVYAYQTYDYVQHDNDFCMSCHLMEQPYEQFGQSAHRGLGCKACHQPTLIARSQMALAQVVENPAELSVHAEVPNERCAFCHIEGDPEEWRLIANTAGHRVHLESTDSILEGLQCVECHSTSVHEFAPVDRTCAQSQCHADNTVQLGGMSDLTIHCVACHNFVAPVAAVAQGETTAETQNVLDAAILPDEEECLSCHVMRTLVDMPNPDPHGGVCASCHNPHVQAAPSEAATSCTNAGCHVDLGEVTGFHRGLRPGALENCVACHRAHDFALDGDDCLSCHDGVNDDLTMPGVPRVAPADTGRVQSVGMAATGTFDPLLGAGMGWWVHRPAAARQEHPPFLHSRHRTVSCSECHSNEEAHGELTVRTLNDCRSCHHSEPVADGCVDCHAPEDMHVEPFEEVRPVEFSVGGGGPRALLFVHAPHEAVECGTCHTGGLDRSAASADCMGCHEDHHEPDTDCASCHRAAPTRAHPPSEAHVTCSGSGCHQAFPFDAVPRTRQVCLGCHQDLREHRPGRTCSECHALPDPRPVTRSEP